MNQNIKNNNELLASKSERNSNPCILRILYPRILAVDSWGNKPPVLGNNHSENGTSNRSNPLVIPPNRPHHQLFLR